MQEGVANSTNDCLSPFKVFTKTLCFAILTVAVSPFRYEKDVQLFKSKVVDSVKLCNSHLFDQPKIEDPYAIRLVTSHHISRCIVCVCSNLVGGEKVDVSASHSPICIHRLVFLHGIQLFMKKQKRGCSRTK